MPVYALPVRPAPRTLALSPRGEEPGRRPPAAATAPRAGRDLRIDSLRGLLLVFMALDHIVSDLQIATYHIFGYFSAAEGFVFLSGLVAGLVYARRLWTAGPVVVQRATWRRAFTLYGCHVALFLFVWAWTIVARMHQWPSLQGGPDVWPATGRVVVAGLLLLNQPPLLDILPMYCGFMFLVPALLRAFDRGQRERVIAVSFIVWALGNTLLPQSPWNHGIFATSALSMTSWQVLFVGGAACGHAWAAGDRLIPKPSPTVIGGAAAICVVGYIVRHAFIAPPIPRPALDWLTNKHSLAPLRLLNTLALFYLFYGVAVTFPRVLEWRPLAFLGKNSLAVFCAHVVAACVLASLPTIFADSTQGRWWGTAAMLALLFLVAAVFSRRAKSRRPTSGARNWGRGCGPVHRVTMPGASLTGQEER